MSVATGSRASSHTSKLTTPAEDTMLQVTPSTLEVDYDTESTELYKAITEQEWDTAISVCQADPVQASVWVVRHSQTDATVLWRFLPLHSACARQPPVALIQALLAAYPDAAACVDDQGMYALHYAAGNQASYGVLHALVDQCPAAVHIRDPRGMIALHYAACWGPGDKSLACIDLLLTPKTVTACDHDGNTAQDLAEQASYPLRNLVVRTLQAARDVRRSSSPSLSSRKGGGSATMHTSTSSSGKRSLLMRRKNVPSVASTSQDSSHEDSRYDIDGRRFQELIDQREQQRQPGTSVSSSSHATSNRRSSPRSMRIGRSETTNRSNGLRSETKASSGSSKSSRSARPVSLSLQTNGSIEIVKEESAATDASSSVSAVDEVVALRATLEQANRLISEKDREILALLEERDAARLEADQSRGLQDTLDELTNQHEMTKRKFKETQDRLASLSVSMESVLEQNKVVKHTLETVKEMDLARQEALEQLSSLDFHVDEARLNSSLQKQQREMEAIAAIIKAARD